MKERKEKEFRIPGSNKLLAMIQSFSATEKVIFTIFVGILIVSTISLVTRINEHFLVPVPTQGGQIDVGVVGLPRLINPVLAFSDTDQDLTSLVYSGLMKYENNQLVPDLAQSYTISPDGLTYAFTIKPDAYFQDGTSITADDVIFTINDLKNTSLKSPQGANWVNITATKVATNQVSFTLKQPYAPFLTNTTIGILPKHIWNTVSTDEFIFSQYNIQPVGSGPYKFSTITRDSGGIPIEYTLVPSANYVGGAAYISKIIVHFYSDESAAVAGYQNGEVQSISTIAPKDALSIASSSPDTKIAQAVLPRIFGVFFNQNQAPILADLAVRQALNVALNKNAIVAQVLSGYGVAINSPIPNGSFPHGEAAALAATSSAAAQQDATTTKVATTSASVSTPATKTVAKKKTVATATVTATSSANLSTPFNPNGDPELAKSILVKDGWTLNAQNVFQKYDKKTGTTTLTFSITTADSPELKQAADMIVSQWAAIGAHVTVKVFEQGELNQTVIIPRKYDALLFGESVGNNLDLYPFWHSSQRNYPGFNISMYVNAAADKLLVDARSSLDPTTRLQKYAAFDQIIQNDVPAVFIYSPSFIYILPNNVNGIEKVNSIETASDRWNGISKWYIDTDNIWKIFAEGNEVNSADK